MRAATPAGFVGDLPAGGGTSVVVVASEQLIRDAVATGLRGLGFAAASRPLPSTAGGSEAELEWFARARPAVGVLVTDLEDPGQAHDAAAVVHALSLPWLILTSSAPGPAWGALLEAGASEVLDANAALADVSRMIREVIAGGRPGAPHRADVLEAWGRVSDEQRALAGRLERLSARELAILMALDDGLSAIRISARDGVAIGTVRAQIRSILRKLEVRSQPRAIAAYREAQAWLRQWGPDPD